ncbi:hypothetical protein JR316_0012982 [Psilocybe cubensis]|uniref:Uncharacterized protein n=2 Tax=Psilocybe cubensis TaxID=181762 RepID=A0ACB8GH41_PSICU|nr:hypothetical protein JR316_0012982 [Psilocybe cubensis]KAH9474521.1 hypothetical protein JR316_0012982 [Psilocybe cubensis]
MGLLSYLLSVKWLRSSGQNGGRNRPTPMQLGLLMSICSGANIGSLFSSMKYLVIKPAMKNSVDRVAPAPILRQSIFALGSLLVISYVASGADAWLHASSTSVLITSMSPYTSSTPSNFGREINATMCQIATARNDSTCGIIGTGSAGTGITLSEGLRVISNTSSLHRVVFTDDQTAILVPQTLPPNITYTSRTLGVKSQCTSITKYCIFKDGVLGYGPQAKLNLNCADAGIKYVNSTGVSGLCPIDNQGLCTSATGIPSKGWFAHGNNGAWNVIFCNVTALDITYTYTSTRFLQQSTSPISVSDTRYMMIAGFYNGETLISTAVNGAGLEASTTYEQAYSNELSRQMLARGAIIYQPKDVIRIESENTAVGSNLQVIPLALFIAALLLFSCQTLWITVRVIIATWNMDYVELAALYIQNPLVVVQSLYGRPDPTLTWDTDVAKRFGTETDRDRLNIGPAYNEFGSVFIVSRN